MNLVIRHLSFVISCRQRTIDKKQLTKDKGQK
jgi:hypothetical protein